MRAYDMDGVELKRRGHYLSLVVPGLAERRPSLVTGDYIFAKPVSAYPSTASISYQVCAFSLFLYLLSKKKFNYLIN